MADPLSVASGIAGLLSLAGAAFRGVHQYIRSVKDAKDFVKALSKELQSLNSVLQGVRVLAEAFEQDAAASSVILRLEHVSACKNVLTEIIKETTKIREAIDNQKSISSKIETLRWPFRKSKTEDLINELSRHKATLSLACDAASLSALVDCLGKVSESERKLAKIHDGVENLQVLRQIQLDAERERVLKFFMHVDPSPNLQTSWKLKHPGTGAWLTESLRFRTWISDVGSKIWLSGIPGAGKTVLAGAAAREALQEAATVPKVGVAFFFCDYKNKETWDIQNILGAIAVHLSQQNESAFLKLQKYYRKIKPALGLQQSPDADGLYEVISDQSEDFDRILLVVDGLDECGDNTGQVSRVLSDLAQETHNMSTAFFSRDEEEIRDIFEEQFDQIEIAAHSDDISLYVGAELDKRIEQGQLRISDMALKDEILSRLLSGAQGMFRWVSCQLDALGECVTDADRRAALYELPKTLPHTYERILERVNQKHRSVQRLVRLGLQFTTLEKQVGRLPITQLCQAVSVPERLGTKWDDSSIVKEQEIARACSSFLRKSADGEYFEFAHFSVREYLEDSSLLDRPDLRAYHISESSASDAVACQYLRFLLLKNFDLKPCRDLGDDCAICTEKTNLYALYQFATTSWPLLVHEIQDNDLQCTAELLELQKMILHPGKSNMYYNWAIQFCDRFHHCVPNDLASEKAKKAFNLVLDSRLSTLHIAAAFNLVEVGTWLLGLDIPITSNAHIGSVFEFSFAGLPALFDDLFENTNWRFSHYRRCSHPSSLVDELSLRGETLSNPSDAFQDRKLMRFACKSVGMRSDFLPLRLLLKNGWKLCSEDLSIARHLLKFDKYAVFYSNSGLFIDFVRCLDALDVYKTKEGHEFCTFIWNLGIGLSKDCTADTSLLPFDITLSDEALVVTAIDAIKHNDIEALVACEQDARFNLHEVVDEHGQYALHIAAMNVSWQALDYIIAAGCEVGKLDSDGKTVLHALASCNEDFADDPTLSSIFADHVSEFQKLMSAVDCQGQTAIDRALELRHYTMAVLLLEHYPKQLGCCHDQKCIWDQAALAASLKVVQALVDTDFPRHLHCAGGRPFHSLSPFTDLETFELLHALYPDSLKNGTNGKLALESCLRSWTLKRNLNTRGIDVEVIRALLRYSEPFSPTSSEAIEFCCLLISDSVLSDHNHRLRLLQPFLESGVDVHHKCGGKCILESACQYFTTNRARDSELTNMLEAILDRVDKKKLNRLNAAGNSILHIVCTSTTIDTEWLIPELVERGADINMFSGNGNFRTPLIASLERPAERSIKSAHILLNLGADPALVKPDGWDAAQVASTRGVETFLRALLLYLNTSSTPYDWKRRSTVMMELGGSRTKFPGLNSLHMACIDGHKDCFDFLLDRGLIKDVHALSEEGFSCLHFAAFDESARMIDYLIGLGLDLNQSTADGSTPLHIAVRKKKKLVLEKLLSKGPVVKKDIFGMTPIMYARKLDLGEIVEILAKYDMSHAEVKNPDVLAQNARHNYWRKALQEAIFDNDVQLCTQIMEEGCPGDISLPGCSGCSPLLTSIDFSSPNRLELVPLFLHNSVSVCKQACAQHSSLFALIKAVERPHLNRFLARMLDLCLREGLENIFRKTLLASVECGNTEALRIILKHFYENVTDYAQFLGRGPSSVISGLINNYGGTMPLHQAVLRSNFEVVMQLVEAGADVNAQNLYRLTPLQYCQAPGNIAEYLLSRGATPTLPPSSTWLHYLGHSAKIQREMATHILRTAPINSINVPFSLPPALHPKALVVIMRSGQNLNIKDESICSIMFAAMRDPGTATLVLNSPVQMAETAPFPWHMLGEPIENVSCIKQHWKHYHRRFGMDELRRVSNLQPNRGWSPLCLATCTDTIEVMKHCFEMGADIDFEGSPFGSALMAATAMNRIESVKFLVRRNASIFYTGKQGFTSAVMAEFTPQRVIDWLLVKRFQDQGKLEATSEFSRVVDDSSNARPRLSWCPTRIQLRLNADFERQPHESLFAYLRRLAIIKKKMRGRIVPVPKPEFTARSEISVVYEI